jgi:hypothetical protein
MQIPPYFGCRFAKNPWWHCLSTSSSCPSPAGATAFRPRLPATSTNRYPTRRSAIRSSDLPAAPPRIAGVPTPTQAAVTKPPQEEEEATLRRLSRDADGAGDEVFPFAPPAQGAAVPCGHRLHHAQNACDGGELVVVVLSRSFSWRGLSLSGCVGVNLFHRFINGMI